METIRVHDGQDITYILPKDLLPNTLVIDNKINFIGFYITKKYFIISVPKKYKYSNKIQDDINLILKVVQKYKKTKGNNVVNHDESAYPIKAYLNIYDYYTKYGLYVNKIKQSSEKNYGKINWKETIKKCDKIISNNNLIFLKQIRNVNNENIVFLSKCMDNILYEGYINFFKYFNITKPYYKKFNFSKYNNIPYILNKLYLLLNSSFKDIEKNLIINCINYYKWQQINTGNIKFLIQAPQIFWQEIINSYLNKNFKEIDVKSSKIIFEKNKNFVKFEKEKTFSIPNNQDMNIKIRVDHYLETDDYICIFDSKYYENDIQLNYKQIAYYYFISEIKNNNKNIISALFIPSTYDSINYHIDRSRIDGLLIFNVYININLALKQYLT